MNPVSQCLCAIMLLCNVGVASFCFMSNYPHLALPPANLHVCAPSRIFPTHFPMRPMPSKRFIFPHRRILRTMVSLHGRIHPRSICLAILLFPPVFSFPFLFPQHTQMRLVRRPTCRMRGRLEPRRRTRVRKGSVESV
jgi:hypothetical protein